MGAQTPRGCGQRNWEVTKEAGGSQASSLKEQAMAWGKPNSKVAHKHQTLENKPGVLLRAPTSSVVRGASHRDKGGEGRQGEHNKIWCNSASHVEMHAFYPARSCKPKLHVASLLQEYKS